MIQGMGKSTLFVKEISTIFESLPHRPRDKKADILNSLTYIVQCTYIKGTVAPV
jgi:hypothetical protein